MNYPDSDRSPALRPKTCLALAGGNALGAYAAGAVEALDAAGYRFDMVSGASIGAVTAVLIAGTRPERRVETLREFWSLASWGSGSGVWPWLQKGRPREIVNTTHVLQTFLFGRPGLFGPRPTGFLSMMPGTPPDVALFNSRPLVATLERLVDFDYLHDEGPQLIVCAVDLETGEPVYFDSRRERITSRHVLASTGFIPGMPPVEIDGRLLGDPGLLCNLPLDPVLAPDGGDVLCFAVDLFSSAGPRPHSLDTSLERAQDIAFATQTARTLQAFRREQRLRQLLRRAQEHAAPERQGEPEPGPGHVDMVLAAYRAPPHEIAAKTLDFSKASLRERWDAGKHDMTSGIERLSDGRPEIDDLGFALYRGEVEVGERIE